MGQPLRIGIVGTGTIVPAYLATLPRLPQLRLVAVADLDAARAAEVAADADVPALDVDGLLARDDVDLVLNLTPPAAHAAVALAAIAAGKHVYGEKPLADTVAAADRVLAAAAAAGVRIGSAPDTVLGVGVQTARRAVDEGRIGRPVAAMAFMTTPGHERWHPAPEFYYQPGGGPLLDMGPYYLSALVHLLGPVGAVTAATSRSGDSRVVGSGPRAGARFPVEVDTHVAATLEHRDGTLSTVAMTFDVWRSDLPRIEVHGTEGSLSVPDPNTFDGEVLYSGPAQPDWTAVTALAGYRDAGRGVGVADLAEAMRREAPHRASAELAYHVLDVMAAVLAAGSTGTRQVVTSSCERPLPVDELSAATVGRVR